MQEDDVQLGKFFWLFVYLKKCRWTVDEVTEITFQKNQLNSFEKAVPIYLKRFTFYVLPRSLLTHTARTWANLILLEPSLGAQSHWDNGSSLPSKINDWLRNFILALEKIENITNSTQKNVSNVKKFLKNSKFCVKPEKKNIFRIFATFPPKFRPSHTAERSESTLIF
jgi:hypothetical protein